MKRLLIIFFALQVILCAQEKDMLYMPKGTTAAIYLTVAPELGESIKIFRSEGNGEFVELTAGKELKSPSDMYEVMKTIGAEYAELKKYLDAEEDYDVYLSIKENGAKAGLVTLLYPTAAVAAGRMFTDSSVVPGKTYTYKVVYYSGSKETDSFTKTVKAEKLVITEPTGLTAELKNGLITLQWKYPKWSENKTNITTNYAVYRKIGTGAYTQVNLKRILRNDAAQPAYTEAIPASEGTAEYYVTSKDPAGNESKASVSVKVKLESDAQPDAPEGLAATAAAEGIKLVWSPPSVPGISGYNLYRRETSAKDTVKVNKSPILVSTPYFYDSLVADGSMYLYYVTSVNAAGKQSKYSQMASALFEDKIPPVLPSDLKLTISKTFIKLDWKKSESADVKGYKIYRGGSKDIMPAVALAQGISFTDSGYKPSGFEAGKKYFYCISAVDNSGNESKQTAIMEINYIDKEAPDLPGLFYTSLTKNTKVEVHIGGTNSQDVKKINVYKNVLGNKQKAKFFYTMTSIPQLITDDTVSVGQSYFYQIELIDTAGNKTALLNSDTILVRDFTRPPTVPDLGASVLKKGGVKVVWMQVVESDLEGYNVYRSPLGNGVYELITKKPVKGLEFTDTAGTTENYYKVRAVDTSGNESDWSDFTGVEAGDEDENN